MSHRRRIFINDMSDWLDPQAPVAALARLLDTIRQCPELQFILCTKRPENFHERTGDVCDLKDGIPIVGDDCYRWLMHWRNREKPPSNVIILASVEDQATVDQRIPELLNIPAACRGLSLEPLLGPVKLYSGIGSDADYMGYDIHWLIIGGESGAKARPCNAEWIRSLVRQGTAAGIPVFVKQLGSNIVSRNDDGFDGDPGDWPMDTKYQEMDTGYQGAPVRVMLKDRAGADPAEWPEDLRVREWPKL